MTDDWRLTTDDCSLFLEDSAHFPGGHATGVVFPRSTGDVVEILATATSVLTVGAAGFALWQVSDDSGSALPPALSGARARAFGLGPEIDLVIPAIRSRLELRLEWELGVKSRVDGTVLVGGLTYLAGGADR